MCWISALPLPIGKLLQFFPNRGIPIRLLFYKLKCALYLKAMKIVINSKENRKLLENFPEDPFADLTIVTSTSTLSLVSAYLSIDSEYFAELDPEKKEVDLSMLPEEPLLKVLKSLYGAELIAYSVEELIRVYDIIEELRIEEYKKALREWVLSAMATEEDSPLLNSIEMLEFCLRKGVADEEVKQFHFKRKLRVLETSRNYLQLNKLSQETLSSLLLDFVGLGVEKSGQIANHIMENFFNRKGIRPAHYFADERLEPLKLIWEQHHHKLYVTDPGNSSDDRTSGTRSSLISSNSRLASSNMLPGNHFDSRALGDSKLLAPSAGTGLFGVGGRANKSQVLTKSDILTENEKLDSRITQLEQQNLEKDILIQQLKDQIHSLRAHKNSCLDLDSARKNNYLDLDSDREDTECSLLGNLKNHNRNRHNALSNLENVREVESFDASKELYNAAKIISKPSCPLGSTVSPNFKNIYRRSHPNQEPK